jgi:cytoskeleton protein RodZ
MSETIGQQLKQAREAKNLPIQKVVQAIHIRANQIQAMEADNFESLPSPVQARGFIRLYSEYLGLTYEEIVANQQRNVGENHRLPVKSGPDPEEQSPKVHPPLARKEFENNQTVEEKSNPIISIVTDQFAHPNDSTVEVGFLEETNKENSLRHKIEVLGSSYDNINFPIVGLYPSQTIFKDIGVILRQRRENLSLTLDEVERQIHVRKHYLQALETGEFDRLVSSVQARGMLNNYAHFLNLDVDALLLKFAEGLQGQRVERNREQGEIKQKPNGKSPFQISINPLWKVTASLKRYFSVDIIVGGGLVIILLSFAIWGTNRIIDLRAGLTPQPTAPSILNILSSTLNATTNSTIETPTLDGSTTFIPPAGETMVLTLPPTGNEPVQVVVIAQMQAWVRVTVDGKVQFQGRVNSGTAYPFEGNQQIEVLTGDGSAVSILYNQNNLGPMGDFGEIVDHIYTANSILNPTATLTPTPTISQTPTATLRFTITPIPSLTPRPSLTPNQ